MSQVLSHHLSISKSHPTTTFNTFQQFHYSHRCCICHVTARAVTSLNHTLMHLLTSLLDVYNLAVEGHWMYWHGIHTDVDDKFSKSFFLSFSLFQAVTPPEVLLLGCGVLVQLTPCCNSFILVR